MKKSTIKLTDKEFQALLDKMDDLPESMSEAQINRSSSQRQAQNRHSVKAKAIASAKLAGSRPEVRAKKSAAAKLAQNRPEVRAKLSAAAKSASISPEVRAKRTAAQKLAQNRPEVRAKMSAVKRVVFTEEEKLLYKQALKHGPMKISMNRDSWSATARKFGLNINKLIMYAKGQNLKDLE